MKKLLLIAIIALFANGIYAQSPEKITYQAVVRDASNVLVLNQAVGVQISILQGSSSGSAVFTETHTVTTNNNGLLTFEIGTGSSVLGSISAIDWQNGPYFVQTEIDPNGGTAYSITGTSEVLSVPYALHATTADSVNESDPLFGASVAAGISSADTAYWNSKLSVEVDSSVTNEIQSLSISNDTLYLSGANSVFIGDTSSSSSYWTPVNTNDIYYSAGNIKVGETQSNSVYGTVTVGDTGDASILLGHSGGFNDTLSGRLIFSEDVSYTGGGTCGFEFVHNGSENTLKLVSGCTSLGDTGIVFRRSGEVIVPESMSIGGGSTAVPSSTLHVFQSSGLSSSNGARFDLSSSGYWNVGVDNSGNFGFLYNGTLVGSINSSTGAYAAASDRSLKNDVQDLPTVLDRVILLKPSMYKYNFAEDNSSFSYGFIAQDLEKLFPEAVTTAGNGKKAVFYDYISVIAVKAIQEQNEIIENQKSEIDDLKLMIQTLEKRMTELETSSK